MDNYRTQSLYEAAFLMAKGIELMGKEDSGHKTSILFKMSPEVEGQVMNFYNGGKIEAKKVFDCYRTLKDYIFTK